MKKFFSILGLIVIGFLLHKVVVSLNSHLYWEAFHQCDQSIPIDVETKSIFDNCMEKKLRYTSILTYLSLTPVRFFSGWELQ